MNEMHKNVFSETIQVNKGKLNELTRFIEELVINKSLIETIKNETTELEKIKILDEELRIVSSIQDSIIKVGLINVETINDLLKKLVHDYSEEKNINVEFSLDGLDTKIENTLLNDINNIFINLIKDIFENEFTNLNNVSNFIKFGVFSSEKKLTVIAETIGKGFDYSKISQQPGRENLDLTSLSESESINFLKHINYLSVMKSLIKLRADLIYSGGNIEFVSQPDSFIKISISIPLTSSIMQGMLVNVGEQIYAIPTDFIESTLNTKTVRVQKSFGEKNIIHMGEVIPLFGLSELLNIDSSKELSTIIITVSNNNKLAILVDSVIDQIDMVIKPKHSMIKDLMEFKGVTILGDGIVTPVLDIPSIIKNI